MRAFALLRDIDKIGLLPGGLLPIGQDPVKNPPEHDGLDLNWPREMTRIHDFFWSEGLEATERQVQEWYGHLEPAPSRGAAPAPFPVRFQQH